MKTRDKILKTAIRLFNKHGVSNVSIRIIATDMRISHGNLEYHFRNKEELVLAIYNMMIAEMSRVYPGDETGKLTFKYFNLLLLHIENFQKRYLFFHLDLIEIARKFPKVSILLQENMQLRKKQVQLFFEKFISDNLIKKTADKNYYQHLQHTMRILITFWFLQNEILTSFRYKKKGDMARHIWELLIPNMTEKGLREYERTVRILNQDYEDNRN